MYLLLGSLNEYLRSQSQEELEKLVHDLASLLVLLGVGAQADADLPDGSVMELLTPSPSEATLGAAISYIIHNDELMAN